MENGRSVTWTCTNLRIRATIGKVSTASTLPVEGAMSIDGGKVSGSWVLGEKHILAG
jgi:hypothetical protein